MPHNHDVEEGARMMSLGGLAPEVATPRREVDRSSDAVADWTTLVGDGSVRQLSLDDR